MKLNSCDLWGSFSFYFFSFYIAVLFVFTTSGNKYLESTYSVPGTGLFAWDKSVDILDWVPQKQMLSRGFWCKGFIWELTSGNADRGVRK